MGGDVAVGDAIAPAAPLPCKLGGCPPFGIPSGPGGARPPPMPKRKSRGKRWPDIRELQTRSRSRSNRSRGGDEEPRSPELYPIREPKEPREPKEWKEPKEPPKEPREPRERKEPKEPPKEPREPKERKEPKEPPKERRETKERKEPKEAESRKKSKKRGDKDIKKSRKSSKRDPKEVRKSHTIFLKSRSVSRGCETGPKQAARVRWTRALPSLQWACNGKNKDITVSDVEAEIAADIEADNGDRAGERGFHGNDDDENEYRAGKGSSERRVAVSTGGEKKKVAE